MDRSLFISHLENFDCSVWKETKAGYTIMRHNKHGKKHGIPPQDPLYPFTIIRICKHLHVPIPDTVDQQEERSDFLKKSKEK